jgi:hypothetical protein
VQHARIDLLILFHIRISESFHGFNQLCYLIINLCRLSLKDLLEIVIRCIVDLFGVLGRSELTREILHQFGNDFFDLLFCILFEVLIQTV